MARLRAAALSAVAFAFASSAHAAVGIDIPLSVLRGNLTAGMLPGAPTAAAGGSDASPLVASLPRSAAQPAWAQVYGTWQHLSGYDGGPDASERTAGVFVGADHDLGGDWRLGGALGMGNSTLNVDDGSVEADFPNYSAALYGGKAVEGVGPGKLMFLGGAGYTWYDVTSKRRVALPGLSQTFSADYGANMLQLFGEVSYALNIAPTVTLEPYVGVIWSDIRRRSFTEAGGLGALSAQSQRLDLTTGTLGLRTKSALPVGARVVWLTSTLGWRHTFGGRSTESTMSFEGGAPFKVAGAPLAQDTAVVELGVGVTAGRDTVVGLVYDGEFGGGNREHGAIARVRWRF